MSDKTLGVSTEVSTEASALAAHVTSRELLYDQTKIRMVPEAIKYIAENTLAIQAQADAEGFSLGHDDDFWFPSDHWMSRFRPYNVKDGVLHIPVFGLLMNRVSFVFGRFGTGYTYIRRAVERGMDDGNVKGIAFIIDSFGGEAAGNFELVEWIKDQRGDKPMRSFIADHALSGGYSIATAADTIVITRSGFSGSVGVISSHFDWSKAFEDAGVAVTLVFAGERKADRSPYKPLSKDAEEGMRNRVNKIYDIFVSTVAENRNMAEDAVRSTEADIFDSEDSVEIGFADRVGSDEEEIDLFATEVGEGTGDQQMSGEDKTNENVFSQAQVDAAVAAAVETAKAEAKAEGVQEERTSWSTLMSGDEAKQRFEVAAELAGSTDMTVEQLNSTLAKIPAGSSAEEASEEQPNAFAEAMDKGDNPEAGSGDGAEAKSDSENILGDYFRATGESRKKKDAA